MSTIGSNPTGVTGRIAGTLMNIIHAGQYSRIIRRTLLRRFDPSEEVSILDIGCGGGKTLGIIASLLPSARMRGIDHSGDMVRLAGRVNRAGIDAGRIEVLRADAHELPFPDSSFDAVTAFDTINFWTDLEKAAGEVRRVLKPGGWFIIVNGYLEEGTKWHDFVKFKNRDEYSAFLKRFGFRDVDITLQKRTIIVSAEK